jgi:hypothetical protein
MDYFLGQHGVDVCLLTETHLRSSEPIQMANYVCYRTDRLTEIGAIAILVRRGIDHYAVRVESIRHLETTAIQVALPIKPVKINAVYLWPSRPLIDSRLSNRLGGGFPVLMAGDLNFKQVDWNSRLITTRDRHLREYAHENSCLIYGSGESTTGFIQLLCHP